MAPATYKPKTSPKRPLSSVLVTAKAAEKRPEANSNGVPRNSSGTVTAEEYYRKLEQEKYEWIGRLAKKDEEEHEQNYED